MKTRKCEQKQQKPSVLCSSREIWKWGNSFIRYLFLPPEATSGNKDVTTRLIVKLHQQLPYSLEHTSIEVYFTKKWTIYGHRRFTIEQSSTTESQRTRCILSRQDNMQ